MVCSDFKIIAIVEIEDMAFAYLSGNVLRYRMAPRLSLCRGWQTGRNPRFGPDRRRKGYCRRSGNCHIGR
jgi:hypothetical protein